MTQEQKTKIGKHFDELHATASGLASNVPDDLKAVLRACYLAGADYALDIYCPQWRSVDEEMPPRWETNPNVSVPVITCKFVNRELQDIDLQRYVFGDSKWQYGDATHWMPFQFPEKGGEQ